MSMSQQKRDVPSAEEDRDQTALVKREFALRLRRLRESADQTQSFVAKALGFASESVYQLWEKGDGNLPSLLNLRKLALHFGVSTDYLLGMDKTPQDTAASEPAATYEEQFVRERQEVRSKLFQLALKGKDWDDPEVDPLLKNHVRSLAQEHRRENVEESYRRLITDAASPVPPQILPPLDMFRTSDALTIQQEVEALFRERPGDRVRRVTLHVLDFKYVPSARLQNILLGMQGAELIKRRQANFRLAVSNGRMARYVLTAPNLRRGDIEDVTMIPLTLGMSRDDDTAATTLIGNFVAHHEDYGVRSLKQEDDGWLERMTFHAEDAHLAFMGIGALDSGFQNTFFRSLLRSKRLSPDVLKSQGVIGNVLYHLIQEVQGDTTRVAWQEYMPKDISQRLVENIDEPLGDEILRAVSLQTLRTMVVDRGAQVVIPVQESERARIVWAALEERWANTVICSLEVAEQLRRLLLTTSPEP